MRGPTPRVNAILTYEKRPGQLANPYSLQKFFGRTAEEQRAHLGRTPWDRDFLDATLVKFQPPAMSDGAFLSGIRYRPVESSLQSR